MKPILALLPVLLLLSACGSLRDSALATDDVYDIPDRSAPAHAVSPSRAGQQTTSSSDDYYDPDEARSAATYRDYYDLAYNDPYYYNYGRFGLGTGFGSFGPSYGMGLSYGWPTTFGSMGLGMSYSTGYGGPFGYNPYWSNSWMSGYGYSPYGYSPFGYGYGGYGYGYGGYGPYRGPWGNCYSCYEPIGYGTVYSPRPSTTGPSTGSPTGAPRNMRNPAGLLPITSPNTAGQATYNGRSDTRDAGRQLIPPRNIDITREGRTPSHTRTPSRSVDAPSRGIERTRTSPSRGDWNVSPSTPSTPSRSFGGGGGRINTPRR